jgi:hypothetical protein
MRFVGVEDVIEIVETIISVYRCEKLGVVTGS